MLLKFLLTPFSHLTIVLWIQFPPPPQKKKLYVGDLIQVPQNMTLFGNKVVTNVIN